MERVTEEEVLQSIRESDAFVQAITNLIDAVGIIGGHAPYWNDVRLYVMPVLRRELAIREEHYKKLLERFEAQKSQ